jgi:uncharacterized integral membrane protein
LRRWRNPQRNPTLPDREARLMHFLKTLFWVIAIIILAAFAHANWTIVTINLWAGLVMETKLPVVVLGAILLGFVPPYAMLRATRWRMQRRLDNIERNMIAAAAADTPTTPDTPPLEP